MIPATNRRVAEALREASILLANQGANPFRVIAWRRAADTVAGLERDLREVLDQEGIEGLDALPHIGYGIAGAIRELLVTGRWGQLERLRGTADPVKLFQRVPGLGPALARRIHETLDVDSLEELEMAAHDGRLETVPGLGPRRAAQIRASLATLLGRHPRRWQPEPSSPAPGVDVLLDWVVLYIYDDHHRERQHTVVTETRGPLAGRRVVRGREPECRALYAGQAENPYLPARWASQGGLRTFQQTR
jgi:hypothetical protein